MSLPIRPDQGHSRHASSDSRRVAMPRRQTKGPLDIDDDSSSPVQPLTPAIQTPLPPSPAPIAHRVASPVRVSSPSTLLSPTTNTNRTRSMSPARQLDLSPLLRPSLYAPIPSTNIAAPFLEESSQPPPDANIEKVLAQHRYRHAGAMATDIMTSGSISPAQTQKILELYHIRLACLVLCSQPDMAAREGKLLSELLVRESSAYARPDRDVFVSQVPWPLRLLLLRLQTLASGDLRRGVMGFYALGSECRALALKARNEGDADGVKMWRSRLCDLGVRVAGELVEMGEFDTARRHLAMLQTGEGIEAEEKRDILMHQTLLLLRVGDVAAAKKCLSAITASDSGDTVQQSVLQALIALSSADYPGALSQLQSLHSLHPSNELIAHNLAIAHLYSNDVTSASQVLESLVSDDNLVFPALLFNLATVYELRTERARDRKLELVDRVASLPNEHNSVGNWERSPSEFKLS